MPRPFSDLSTREVLSLAVAVEKANARRFQAFADFFRGYDDGASRKCEDLEREEIEHERLLTEEFRKSFFAEPDEVDESDVREVVEAIELDDGEALVFDTVSARKVLELTLRSELAAQAFYRRAASETENESLRRLYEQLAGFEEGHVAWAKARLQTLRP